MEYELEWTKLLPEATEDEYESAKEAFRDSFEKYLDSLSPELKKRIGGLQ